MAPAVEQHICPHCGTRYTALTGNRVDHCVHCFSCGRYLPLREMYGRVAAAGYCCRACETAEQWSHRLKFDMLLQAPPK